LDLLGETKLLTLYPLFPRPTLDLFTVHVVLQSPVASSSHGTIHAAFRRVAALCIPLLRPNRHQRLLERIVSARASGSFLSPDPRGSNPEQGGCSGSVPMTIRTGWKLLPGTTTSPSSGPKKVSAKRIRSCPGCAECARKAPLESISFLRAWNKGRPSGSVCRSILPKTPTTGSWRISAAASR